MPISLSLILEQENYKYLPQNLREDIKDERCPTEVAWELMSLQTDAAERWGRKISQDWVRRAYKKTKKASSTEEKLGQIKKYLESRRYENIKKEWHEYYFRNEIVHGQIYILADDTWPGVLIVGMVHKRLSKDRVLEIRRRTGQPWNIIYQRETLNPKESESTAHARLPNRLNPKEELFMVSPSMAISIVDESIDIIEVSIYRAFEYILKSV